MKSIILVGYMCVGKTTVGRTLAKELNSTFYDLDWYIEERFHTKVSKIFAEKGEDHFATLNDACCMKLPSLRMLCCRVVGVRPVFSTIWTI